MKHGFRILLMVSFAGFVFFAWAGFASRSIRFEPRSVELREVSSIAPDAQQRILPGPLPEVVQVGVPTTQPEVARSVIGGSTVSITSP